MVEERRAAHQRKTGDQPVTNDDLDEALSVHSEDERAYVKSLIDEVMWAFPDGPANHRNYHEAKIKAARAEEEFWHTAKDQLVKAGVNGLVTLVKVVILLAMLGLTVKFTLPEAFAKMILGALSK